MPFKWPFKSGELHRNTSLFVQHLWSKLRLASPFLIKKQTLKSKDEWKGLLAASQVPKGQYLELIVSELKGWTSFLLISFTYSLWKLVLSICSIVPSHPTHVFEQITDYISTAVYLPHPSTFLCSSAVTSHTVLWTSWSSLRVGLSFSTSRYLTLVSHLLRRYSSFLLSHFTERSGSACSNLEVGRVLVFCLRTQQKHEGLSEPRLELGPSVTGHNTGPCLHKTFRAEATWTGWRHGIRLGHVQCLYCGGGC